MISELMTRKCIELLAVFRNSFARNMNGRNNRRNMILLYDYVFDDADMRIAIAYFVDLFA
jgi:hypothetical protein